MAAIGEVTTRPGPEQLVGGELGDRGEERRGLEPVDLGEGLHHSSKLKGPSLPAATRSKGARERGSSAETRLETSASRSNASPVARRWRTSARRSGSAARSRRVRRPPRLADGGVPFGVALPPRGDSQVLAQGNTTGRAEASQPDTGRKPGRAPTAGEWYLGPRDSQRTRPTAVSSESGCRTSGAARSSPGVPCRRQQCSSSTEPWRQKPPHGASATSPMLFPLALASDERKTRRQDCESGAHLSHLPATSGWTARARLRCRTPVVPGAPPDRTARKPSILVTGSWQTATCQLARRLARPPTGDRGRTRRVRQPGSPAGSSRLIR